MDNAGEVKVFNPAKQESERIVFPIIEGHKYAIGQARTGQTRGTPIEKIDKNTRQINRVKALHLIISFQKDMIQNARPIARYKSLRDWEKKYKESERIEHTFEKEDNDYNSLMKMKKLLDFFDMEIIRAEKSKTKEDDFLIERETENGIEVELTKNFNEMFDELEDTYEEIYLILIKHKIVSAGISEDEEMTYKEQEKEFINRMKEA